MATDTRIFIVDDDPDYLDLFKRSEGLIVDGSLNQAIWQSVA